MTTDAYTPRYRLLVNGVERSLLGGRSTISSRAYVATATLDLLISEGYPSPGDTVQVHAGLGYSLAPVFTGSVDTVLPQLDRSLQVQCSGALWRTNQPLGTTSISPTGGQVPIVSYTSQAASVIISDLLRRAGVLRVQLQDSGTLFGVSQPITLYDKDNAATLIKKLDEAEYYRTFDGPDGTVYRIPWQRTPGSVSRTWVEGTDLYTGRLQQTRLGTKNRILCTGLPQVGTTNISYTPAAERDAPSPYVPNPPGYFALSYQNDLLESGAACDAWAATKLGELNRLTGELPFELAVGDNSVLPGMTVALTSATLNVPAGARFLVEEVVHDFSQGYQTSGTLFMVSTGAGWNPNQKPIAIFAEQLEQETLADGSSLTVVAVDGSASYDPDNNVGPTRGIVSYVWSGTLGSAVVVPGSGGAQAVYTTSLAPSALAGSTIVLTVTDNQGATGSSTLTIGNGSAPINVRDLWSAEGTALSYSGDGAKTWQDVTPTIAAVGVCRISADTFTLAWDSSGVLWRVATTGSAPTGASIAGLPFVTSASINTIAGSSRCFAGCQNGAVYFSPDGGVTWSLLSTVPNGQAVTRIEESPFATGDLTAVTGPILYHSFSNGAAWDAQYTAASGLAIADFAAGFGNGFLILNGTFHAGEPSRVQERNGTVAGDFATADKPAQPYALTIGVGRPVLCTVGLDATGGPEAWYADASAPFTFARGHYTSAWGTPRDLIRDGTLDGLVYGAADSALFKTADYFAGTAFKLKTLAAGRAGKMIGYGRLHSLVSATTTGTVVVSVHQHLNTTLGNAIYWHTAAGGWSKLSDHPGGNGGDFVRPIRWCGGTIYVTWLRPGGGGTPSGTNAWVSTNGAVTWTPLSLTGVYSLKQSRADGRLWAIHGSRDHISYSTDNGATWTGVASPGSGLMDIAPDPLVANTLSVNTDHIFLSTNGGASWASTLGERMNCPLIRTWNSTTTLAGRTEGVSDSYGGLFYEVDGATAFGDPQYMGLVHGIGRGSGVGPESIAFQHVGPNTLLAVMDGRVLVDSEASGKVWTITAGDAIAATTVPVMPAYAAGGTAPDGSTIGAAAAYGDPSAGDTYLAHTPGGLGGPAQILVKRGGAAATDSWADLDSTGLQTAAGGGIDVYWAGMTGATS